LKNPFDDFQEEKMTDNSISSSANDSLGTIQALEGRIAQLEDHVHQLEKQISYLQNRLPNTSLLSPKLLTRAFTVYGHSILAGLIIGIPLTICYFLFIAFYISTSGY
jgi:hypothetical protein